MRTGAMMVGALAAAVAASTFSVGPRAQTDAGSNFGSFTYPPHNCGGAPVVPLRQSEMTSTRSVDDYNREVDAYNSRLAIYAECISAYVARARNDVEDIRRKAADASATLTPAPRNPR